MRIRKIGQTPIPPASEAQVLDGYSTSTTDAYSCNYVNNHKNDYNTAETRIGTWINNKPLYRRVITGTSPNSASEGTVTTLSNIDTMVNLKGFLFVATNATVWFPYYFGSNNNYGYIYYLDTTGEIRIANMASAYQNRPITIIVEYTKTTDSVS